MKLLFYVPSENLIATYDKVCKLLRGHDTFIFNAAIVAMGASHRPFKSPADSSEYEQKHNEIKSRLSRQGSQKLLTTIQLMEEIWRQILVSGGVPGLSNDKLLETISFETTQGVLIYLTSTLRWAVQWKVPLFDSRTNYSRQVSLEIYEKDWGEVVPSYIIQYIASAINAYQQGMTAAAAALLSITVEATLRDVLATKGYSFNSGASSVDVYKYTTAEVGVDGKSYTVTFQDDKMPKSAAIFSSSINGLSTVKIEVRRVINQRKKRVDLTLKVPPELIEHWSDNTVESGAQKRVNGLGEALDIARNKEGFLTPATFPEDFEDVIKVVRNNLIHLSEEALTKPLYTFDSSGKFTLKEFLDDPETFYDFLMSIPLFVNEQYVNLRQAGYFVS